MTDQIQMPNVIKKYQVQHPLLKSYIKFFWELSIEQAELNHRIIPQRNINIRINLNDTAHYATINSKEYLLEDVYFSGLQDKYNASNLCINPIKYRVILSQNMYISNMTHFLDDTGNIPTQMTKQARELAGFHALVVDATTKEQTGALISTGLRCFTKKCVGLIESEIISDTDEIHWYCIECDKEGFISAWQGTKWDKDRLSSRNKKATEVVQGCFFILKVQDQFKKIVTT